MTRCPCQLVITTLLLLSRPLTRMPAGRCRPGWIYTVTIRFRKRSSSRTCCQISIALPWQRIDWTSLFPACRSASHSSPHSRRGEGGGEWRGWPLWSPALGSRRGGPLWTQSGGLCGPLAPPDGGRPQPLFYIAQFPAESLYEEHSRQLVRDTPLGLKPSGF